MSSVRRKLFKEGSNSWASETIVESQNNEAFENGRTEIIEYTVINEGDAAVKEQIVENPHGLKTPQENVFGPVAPSFSEKVIKPSCTHFISSLFHESTLNNLQKISIFWPSHPTEKFCDNSKSF